MKGIGRYKNGNYNVLIFDDGTKIRETKEDKFQADFPECIDLKITDFCDMGCPYCHENSTKDGRHAILSQDFIDTLRPYTELAIGGGNPISHPNIIEFLKYLKKKKIIANITINQKHFEKDFDFINKLMKEELIYELGISVTNINDSFMEKVQKFPNAVLHVINGIIEIKELEKLYDKNLKILILGYKEFRRGKSFYSEKIEENKKMISKNILEILSRFKIVSFDNLALKQLEMEKKLGKDWNEFYMGDDGQFTMYIDLVNNQFARNSTSINRYKILKNIDEMFKVVKEEIEGI